MLRDGTGFSKTYIAVGFTDMRLGIDSLALLIQEKFHLNPLEKGTLFLFCGRRCDRIKAILYEPDGIVLLYKRLDSHVGRYQWPRNKSEVKSITWRQFDWLMSGLEIDQPKAIQRR